MKTHSFRSHTPAEQRRFSDLAHRLEGALLAAVGAFALAEALGAVPWAALSWRVLLVVAGALLLAMLYVLHPRDDWGSIHRDPQQRQHTIMAALLLVSGGLEIIAMAAALPLAAIAWPVALGITGWLFLTHPQHGSGEAVAEATRRHRWLGWTLILAGALRLVAIVTANGVLALTWPIALLAAAAQLFLYREPPGAYERAAAVDHSAHR